MRVDVERRSDLLVTETPLNNLRRHAGGQQQGRACVPEPVELDRPHLGGLDDARVETLAQIVGLQRIAQCLAVADVAPFLREHQLVVVIAPPVLQFDGDRRALCVRRRSPVSEAMSIVRATLPLTGVKSMTAKPWVVRGAIAFVFVALLQLTDAVSRDDTGRLVSVTDQHQSSLFCLSPI